MIVALTQILPLFGDVVYANVRFDLKNQFTPTSDDESEANADAVPNDEVERPPCFLTEDARRAIVRSDC